MTEISNLILLSKIELRYFDVYFESDLVSFLLVKFSVLKHVEKTSNTNTWLKYLNNLSKCEHEFFQPIGILIV